MGLKWLITGGCGFLGTSLIQRLMKEGGHEIRVLDDLSVGTRDDLSEVCQFVEMNTSEDFSNWSEDKTQLIVGNIMDDKLAVEVTKAADVIVHLAANTGVGPSVEDPRTDCMYNVIGTFNYLEGARLNKVDRFIFASSGAPAGEVEPPIHEEMPPHPVSPYGASKLAGEGYCSAYFKTFGVNTVCLRFGNVYGPRSKHKSSVVAKFIKHALNGEILEIYGDGTQTRDFIYIDDLINAVVLASTKDNVGGEVFQIASNRETTVGEMVEMLLPILGANGIKGVQLKYGEKRLGDVMRNYSDTTKARDVLEWVPLFDLEMGIENTLVYFLKTMNFTA